MKKFKFEGKGNISGERVRELRRRARLSQSALDFFAVLGYKIGEAGVDMSACLVRVCERRLWKGAAHILAIGHSLGFFDKLDQVFAITGHL